MSMLPARHLPVLPDFAELWNAFGPGRYRCSAAA